MLILIPPPLLVPLPIALLMSDLMSLHKTMSMEVGRGMGSVILGWAWGGGEHGRGQRGGVGMICLF